MNKDMKNIDITLIRSKRKSISIQVKPEGLIIRAPLKMSDAQIMAFLDEKRSWIEKHLAMLVEENKILSELKPYTTEEIQKLTDKALMVIPKRVEYYAPLIGVDYGNITIRNQRTRWGSCSDKGNLNFNCLLMEMPDEIIDSVVVHELCHRKHMNHSPQFYAEIEKVFPQYKKCNKWLKENGGLYLRRMG